MQLSDPKATEMLDKLVDDLQALENGIVVFDAAERKDVVLLAPVLMVTGDNPRQSEMACHAGKLPFWCIRIEQLTNRFRP